MKRHYSEAGSYFEAVPPKYEVAMRDARVVEPVDGRAIASRPTPAPFEVPTPDARMWVWTPLADGANVLGGCYSDEEDEGGEKAAKVERKVKKGGLLKGMVKAWTTVQSKASEMIDHKLLPHVKGMVTTADGCVWIAYADGKVEQFVPASGEGGGRRRCLAHVVVTCVKGGAVGGFCWRRRARLC